MDAPIKTKQTQNKAILEYLRKHKKGITNWDAYREFSCTRLSARIFDLREEGHNIITVQEKNFNQFGHTTNYARYILNER